MTYEEIVSRVAGSLDLNKKLVDRVYKSYWRVIKEHISSLPLTDDLTDEELLKLKTNINIPSLGKLYVAPDRYRRLKTNIQIKKEKSYVTHYSD